MQMAAVKESDKNSHNLQKKSFHAVVVIRLYAFHYFPIFPWDGKKRAPALADGHLAPVTSLQSWTKMLRKRHLVSLILEYSPLKPGSLKILPPPLQKKQSWRVTETFLLRTKQHWPGRGGGTGGGVTWCHIRRVGLLWVRKCKILNIFCPRLYPGDEYQVDWPSFWQGVGLPPPPTAINPDTLPLSTFHTKMAVRNGR